jgi:hypothetical protein
MSFEKNIFINCPFDNDYFPLLKSILFTVIYLDYNPKISETADSGSTRINKIKDLIKFSKYSIHDLSRIQSDPLPRFNMPFECGIDIGFKIVGSGRLKEKVCLILETEKYRYQQFISDIAGNDIRAHEDKPELVSKHIRDWLTIQTGDRLVDYLTIWGDYNEFKTEFDMELISNNRNPNDISALTFTDIIDFMSTWIDARER